MSQEEIIQQCKDKVGFKTKDEAMRHILETIKEMIAKDKAQDKVNIVNVRTLEAFSVETLKFRFENGEFDYLYKEDEQ
jgi:hypothetical protein